MQDRTVLVVHVPKAAGTTLRWIIDRQYPQEHIYKVRHNIAADVEKFRTLTDEKKRGARVVFGHFCFGLHESLAQEQPYTYITLLRDPAERVASLYYYARVGKAFDQGDQHVDAHYLYDAAHKMTLKEFATSGVTQTTDNAMVRQLCGLDKFTMKDGHQQPYDDMVIPFGQVTRKHLSLAQQNIEQHFALVGFAEQFDESIRRLQALFAWRVPEYGKLNQTPGKPRALPVTARVAVEDQNALDRELYNWALDRFMGLA